MRISGAIAGLAAALCTSSAFAHSGSNILTVSSTAERAAMTAGVSFEEVNGVHVFRGNAQEPATTLLGAEPAPPARNLEKEIRIEIRKRPWRTIRRLRTQGFYSGVPYPSRPYTQGFYSTGR